MIYIQLPADARGYWARYCDLPVVNRPLSLLSQSLRVGQLSGLLMQSPDSLTAV